MHQPPRHTAEQRFLLSLIMALLGVTAPLHAQPCPVTWGPTVQISKTTHSAFVPKLAVVGDTLHVTYVARNLYYRRSTDRGTSWDSQIVLIPFDSIGAGAKPIAAFRNYVFVTWGNRNASGATTSIKFRRSTDAGETWLEPQVLFRNVNPFEHLEAPKVAVHDSMVFIVMYKRTGLNPWFLTRSHDYGLNWDSVRQITFSRYGSAVGAAADIRVTASGAHFTFERSIPPSAREIVYTRSTDRGVTWDSLTILSTIDTHQAWEPNVAADESGNVYVSWQDAKYGSIGGFAGTVLLRKSTDNGTTWLPEIVVSPLPSAERSSLAIDDRVIHVVWDDERSGVLNRTIQYRGSTDQGVTWCPEITIGDTLDVVTGGAVASFSGIVHTSYSSNLWTGGNAKIYYRRGDVITGVFEDRQMLPQTFIVSPLYPNPFNPVTSLQYFIPFAGHVTIRVFDNIGREVANIVDEHQSAGEYRFNLNGSQWASGVYYVAVRFNNKLRVRGAILMR